MTTSEVVEGLVEASNASGLRVRGVWYNVSKFRPVEIPPINSRVRLSFDGKGFMTHLERLGDDSPNGTPAAFSNRNETITRLAVLKAAAEFGASRPDLKSSEVLMIADKWLAWINGDG